MTEWGENPRGTYEKALERIAELEAALQEIVRKDASYMYATCPDCCTDSCDEKKMCKERPYSQIGKLANKALEIDK